jgi:hypothetical protein
MFVDLQSNSLSNDHPWFHIQVDLHFFNQRNLFQYSINVENQSLSVVQNFGQY